MSNENTISIKGDMTIYEAQDIKSLFEIAIISEGDVCVNLSKVSEVDTSGLQLMIALKKNAEQQNKKVTFEAHTQAVIELFDLFDIASCFGDPIVMDKSK